MLDHCLTSLLQNDLILDNSTLIYWLYLQSFAMIRKMDKIK